MEIEILDIWWCENKTELAWVNVLYCGLFLYCDLVYYSKGKKAWIRMPERWVDSKNKIQYCAWPNPEISDEFQKEVLKKLYEKYDLDEDKVSKIHADACEKRSKYKNE